MWHKNIAGSLFFGLVTKHACDRWTDGRTDRQTELPLQDYVSIAASRGENHFFYLA